MERLTTRQGEHYIVKGDDNQAVIDRLAIYENMMETICKQKHRIEEELDQLRQEKKGKTMKFQQRLGEKMICDRFITMFEFEEQKVESQK